MSITQLCDLIFNDSLDGLFFGFPALKAEFLVLLVSG